MIFFNRKKKKSLESTNVAPEPKITEFFIGIPGYYIDTDKEVNIVVPELTEYIYYDFNSLYIRIITSEIYSFRNQESCTPDESLIKDSLCDEIYNNIIKQLAHDESVEETQNGTNELKHLKGTQHSFNETPTIHLKAPTKDTNLFQNELEKIKINLKNEIDKKTEKQQLESENQKIIGSNKETLLQKLQIEYYSSVSQVAAANSSFNQKTEKAVNKELEKLKKKALAQALKDEKRRQKKIKKQSAKQMKHSKATTSELLTSKVVSADNVSSDLLRFTKQQSVSSEKIEKEVV